MSGKLSAQLCAVGAGSLHPDPENRTPAGDPGFELLIAGFGGWEALVGDLPADPVDDAHHVNIGVGVDSHPHLLVLVLAAHRLLLGWWWGVTTSRSGQDSEGREIRCVRRLL